MHANTVTTDRSLKHMPDSLDSTSLLAEVRYWDRIIDRERGRSTVQVLALLEEQRAWALVRLLNLVGDHGKGKATH